MHEKTLFLQSTLDNVVIYGLTKRVYFIHHDVIQINTRLSHWFY